MSRTSARRALPARLLQTLPVALATLLATAVPATAAAPVTDYEMPFPCAQSWTGTTRPSHSPSSKAIDWNRTDDLGDPVVAAAPGVVSTAVTVDKGGYGKYVVVDHAEGESSLYAHLSEVAVQVGQTVDQGTLLGLLGETGNTTGPHLHFEERKDRVDVDPWFHGVAFTFGSTLVSQNCVDVPLSANMVGGAEWEVVVFRRGEPSTFVIHRLKRPDKTVTFGSATDEPVLGDWDGDGRANVGVRDAATRTFRLLTPAGVQTVVYGGKKDRPIAGDWDGDGVWEVGVRRPSVAAFKLRAADGTIKSVTLGDADDLPVTGDWDGDGATDVGVYDQATSTYTLRLVDADGLVWTASVPFGTPGDLPVVGDWDGNGKSDLGVWDPATAVFSQRKAPAPTATARTIATVQFGNPR